MKVHIIGTRNSSQPAELLGDYRGWMRPAWMWSCILGSVVAITASAIVAAFVSTYLAEYRSGVHRLFAVELMAVCAVSRRSRHRILSVASPPTPISNDE